MNQCGVRYLFVCIFSCLLNIGYADSHSTEEKNVISAYVNDDFITQAQVQQMAVESGESKDKALELMIEQKLLLQDFQDKKGRILDVQMDAQLDAIVQNNFQGNRGALVKVLHDDKRSLGGLKEEVRVSIISNIMQQQKMTEKYAISPKKIREYYEQHKSDFEIPAKYLIQQSGFKADSTIVIEENSVLKLDHLNELKKEGKSLDVISQTLDEFSSEPAWYTSKELSETLVECLNGMKIGEATSYITLNGVCVVTKLLNKNEATVKALSDVQSDIETILLEEVNNQYFREYVDFLRSKAVITYQNKQ